MFIKIACRVFLLAILGCAAPVFAHSQGTILVPEPASDERAVIEDGEKIVRVYYQQVVMKDNKTRFYMWIHYLNFNVRNSSSEMRVGFDMGRGGLYISQNNPSFLDRMFFVTNYDDGDLPGDVIVWFGGARADDINIRLPAGYTAKIEVRSLSEVYDPAQ